MTCFVAINIYIIEIFLFQPSQLYRAQNSVFVRRPFGALSALNTNREGKFHNLETEHNVITEVFD